MVSVPELPKLPPDPNADLKQELASQDKALEQLKQEVTALRIQAQMTQDHAPQN